MKTFISIASMAALISVSLAQAEQIIDVAADFQNRQRRSDIRHQIVNCENRLRNAEVISFSQRKAAAVEKSETSSESAKESNIPIATTIEIEAVHQRLTDFRLNGKLFQSKEELNRFAHSVYLAAAGVFRGSSRDEVRLRLLLENFYEQDRGFPQFDARHKLLTALLAGLDLERAFDLDPKLPDILLEWRVSHTDFGQVDPMDDIVKEKLGMSR